MPAIFSLALFATRRVEARYHHLHVPHQFPGASIGIELNRVARDIEIGPRDRRPLFRRQDSRFQVEHRIADLDHEVGRIFRRVSNDLQTSKTNMIVVNAPRAGGLKPSPQPAIKIEIGKH
jgi:hypothetical protein